MPDASHATAAECPVTFQGQAYTLRPLTVDDYGELTMWVRARALKAARASTVGLSQKEADAAMDQAYRLVDGMDWYSVASAGLTDERFAHYIWQHFKRTYPRSAINWPSAAPTVPPHTPHISSAPSPALSV